MFAPIVSRYGILQKKSAMLDSPIEYQWSPDSG
jgi:hypothetical protein